MTAKEIVIRAIDFDSPERLPMSLKENSDNDIVILSMDPHVDARPSNQHDEWGAYWENIGICSLGEVKEFPLTSWNKFEALTIPDVRDEKRWVGFDEKVKNAEGQFIMGMGISLYERAHFLRGLQNLWTDIYLHLDELKILLDILVDMNIAAIDTYAEYGIDGYIWCDDWGLQESLMISPEKWREIWKPLYTKVYAHCKKLGIKTILHSCGNIVDILDDLIECGLDVIQMDQQENMGIDLLSSRFRGKVTFWNPVDIQKTMARGNTEEIRSYCRNMVKKLGTVQGGFIAKYYSDPIGAGHSEEAVEAMCDEFKKLVPYNT
jgi:uroporphyrinogen decarboxylase